MHKFFAAAAALILMAAGTTVAAQQGQQAAHTATGVIKDVDFTDQVMTLDDGSAYELALEVEVDRVVLMEGQEVQVEYRMDGQNRIATNVTPTAPEDATLPTLPPRP